jgi:hypothetical protein
MGKEDTEDCLRCQEDNHLGSPPCHRCRTCGERGHLARDCSQHGLAGDIVEGGIKSEYGESRANKEEEGKGQMKTKNQDPKAEEEVGKDEFKGDLKEDRTVKLEERQDPMKKEPRWRLRRNKHIVCPECGKDVCETGTNVRSYMIEHMAEHGKGFLSKYPCGLCRGYNNEVTVTTKNVAPHMAYHMRKREEMKTKAAGSAKQESHQSLEDTAELPTANKHGNGLRMTAQAMVARTDPTLGQALQTKAPQAPKANNKPDNHPSRR